jgi:hypothetical protein
MILEFLVSSIAEGRYSNISYQYVKNDRPGPSTTEYKASTLIKSGFVVRADWTPFDSPEATIETTVVII